MLLILEQEIKITDDFRISGFISNFANNTLKEQMQ